MRTTTNIRPRATVRAWGGEPVILFLHHVDKTHAYVCRDGSETFIGLPFGDVFVFDEQKFSTARAAFESSDGNKLTSAYSEMDNLSCNRYQDILESQHEKAKVKSPQSITRGSGKRATRG